LQLSGGAGGFGNEVLRLFLAADGGETRPTCASCLMKALLTDSGGLANTFSSFSVSGNEWYNPPPPSKLRCQALDKTYDNT
jgi:hypothetical protein